MEGREKIEESCSVGRGREGGNKGEPLD